MRVRIIFDLENKGAAVPFHHQNLLSGFLKKLILKNPDSPFQDFMHYTFSGLKGHTKVSRKGLHFYSRKVTLVFSSLNREFIDHVIESLFELERVEIGALRLIPSGVDVERMPEFKSETKFICISPIVLRPPQFEEMECKAFISPMVDRFSDLLYEAVMSRMEMYGYEREKLESFYKFQIDPDKAYLEKLKQNGKKFARIYPVYQQDIKYDMRGYTMPFTLFASKEVTEFVYTCGLGSCTHKGFGMVDIVDYLHNKVIEPYHALSSGENLENGEAITLDR
ncbi:MAG: CRISPR-associated endoribonuclease Cas6 [Bacteroidota bacterium]